MSRAARRLLTEEDRARIQAARNRGGLCAGCSRALEPGETVWLETVDGGRFYGGKSISWRAPVGRECATPETLQATEGQAPAPCAGCGRGVLGRAPSRSRTLVVCSRRCGRMASATRVREKRQ